MSDNAKEILKTLNEGKLPPLYSLDSEVPCNATSWSELDKIFMNDKNRCEKCPLFIYLSNEGFATCKKLLSTTTQEKGN